MLYPDFKELLELKTQLHKKSLSFKLKSTDNLSGDYLSQFRGQGIEFDEVRKYAIGDDIRKIDWRITARSGTPYIKLFKEQRQLNVIVCVDMNSYMRFGTRGTFKSIQAAKCASIIGWSTNNNQDSFGAYLFGDLKERELFFPLKKSRYSLWRMLQTLSEEPEITNDYVMLNSPIKMLNKIIKNKSLVFFISDFLNIDDNFSEELSSLSKKSQVTLISVNDIADMQIPSFGNISFLDNYQNQIEVNTDNITGQKNYQIQWQQNRDKLEKIALQSAVKIISVKTDEDPCYKLLKEL